MLQLDALQKPLFLFIYHLLGPDSYVTGFTVFLGNWFPYLLILFALVYELFIRDDDDTVRSMLRIYTPPLLVLGMTEFFKLFFSAPRPFAILEIPYAITVFDPYGSFPSSHSAFFASLAVTMYFCNPKLGKWYLLSALLIGIARIGAGVHWPLDVLAGLIFGLVVGYIIEKISLMIWKERAPRC